MKKILALAVLLGSATASAAPLVPVDTRLARECTARIHEVTYEIEAACWFNLSGEPRLWFPETAFAAIRETGINTKYIVNTADTCANTNVYTYDQLFGESATPEIVEARPVKIVESQLDVSACFVAK